MTLNKIFKNEMAKIKNKSYVWKLYTIAYPNEIVIITRKLRDAKIKYRTEPVIENKRLKTYKVYVL